MDTASSRMNTTHHYHHVAPKTPPPQTPAMSLYRIGVDVGGTNIDAALLDIAAPDSPGRGVLATHKTPTTPDITRGIQTAIQAVLAASRVPRHRILSVTIGTTHFINALLECDARRLDRVAVVRLCGPFTRQLPPLAGFPPTLHALLAGGVYYLSGGLEMDGREIEALDVDQVRRAARDIVKSGVRAVALVGVFSPLDHNGVHEKRCKAIMLDDAPELDVVCSRDVGTTGLLERENATVLNAAILRTGRRVKASLAQAVARLHLRCQLFLSQNDGTLIDADSAAEFPIKTFASGPTNSMTGAAFLAGIDRRADADVKAGLDAGAGAGAGADAEEPQVLVVDIGGTTTDVCALLPSGFPRQAPGYVDIGGVRTAFSMPEVVSFGLGGGSKVTFESVDAISNKTDATSNNTSHDADKGKSSGTTKVTVGPASVGHLLTQQARVFGGPTLTATDIVVAGGHATIGDARLVHDLPPAAVRLASRAMHAKLEKMIGRSTVSPAPVHVLLVGGGALLVSDKLAGVERCVYPVHGDAANAVGAAIAKVSGEVDVLEVLGKGRDVDAVERDACRRAVDLAVERGADREDVVIVEVEKTPLQYMAQLTLRVQVRAVGRLAIPSGEALSRSSNLVQDEEAEADEGKQSDEDDDEAEDDEAQDELGYKQRADDKDTDEQRHEHDAAAAAQTTKPALAVDLATYRPTVHDGIWYLSEVDLELLATGCGVLGTGGGGTTYYEYLKCLDEMRRGGAMRVISPASLADDAVVCMGAWYGSPSVINERTSAGCEIIDAIKAVNAVKGYDKFDALFSDEVGGGNGLCALPTSVHFDVPVVDGDAMGRAFPTMYHLIFSVYGHQLEPCSITSAAGNVSIVTKTDSPVRLERLMRASAIELGLACASSSNPVSGAVVKAHGLPNTLSQAWYLGRAVHLARRSKTSYVDAIFDVCAGKLLYTGKITHVERHLGGGYTLGTVIIGPLSPDELDAPSSSSKTRAPVASEPHRNHMAIPFQNEYLYATFCDASGSDASRQVVCTVPNLISILGQDGEAIGSQELRYGLHVNVIALPAHPLWRTERALKVGGPKGFALDMDEVGVDNEFVTARSVIDEYGDS